VGNRSEYEEIRVLHVDDDPNQFEFIKFFLNQADPALIVNCVSTPEEVFNELGTGKYDCLVTDFQMPLMNGIDLATKVRETHTTPIILYTGQGSEEVAEAAFTVGVNDYIRKEMDPSHYKVLGKRIRDAVEKKRVENLYRNVIEQTRDALSIIVDGHMVFCNRSTLDLFNVKDITQIPENIFSGVQTERDFFEVSFKNNRRETLHIEVSRSPIIYNGKEAQLCFARDVTEKKNLELATQKSQERFQTLVDLVPDGIVSVNPLGYITFVNDTFLKLTGFDEDEILNRHLTKLGTIRKQDLLKHIQTFATIIKGNIPPPIEFHWEHKDGTPCIGIAHISLIEVGGKKEILMIARDITAERRRQHGYEALFEKAPDAIIEMDELGVIMSINEKAIEYSEFSKDTALGKHFNLIYNIEEGEIEAIHNIFNTTNVNATLSPFEIKLLPPNGGNLWLEGHPSILQLDNAIYGYQFVFRDVTERKTIEMERKLYAQKLEQIIMENAIENKTVDFDHVKTEMTTNLNNIEESY
jgi:PAS domain S-box-containing protein